MLKIYLNGIIEEIGQDMLYIPGEKIEEYFQLIDVNLEDLGILQIDIDSVVVSGGDVVILFDDYVVGIVLQYYEVLILFVCLIEDSMMLEEVEMYQVSIDEIVEQENAFIIEAFACDREEPV